MRHRLILMAAFAALCLLSSCYKLLSTSAPKVVEAGQTFEVSFTVVDDGSSTQNFVTDWSFAGVRVPEGWTVTVPTGAHQQFAEDWVYYSDGSKVNSSHDMMQCDKLSSFYNSVCKKAGYTWHGFQSRKRIPKNISACWRNGCDSIKITFLVSVPEDAKPGKYQIDFMGGDEEDEQGISKYASYADAKGSRLFHVSTASCSYAENVNTSLSCKVEVADVTSVRQAKAETENAKSASYDLSGRKLVQPRRGQIYIQDGKKTLK